jgi:carboxymethylenebutenolidase
VEVGAEIVDAETPDGPMAILRKAPVGAAAVPTVVMFHDGPGIRGATHEFATKLAAQGYQVLVPDLYHRHGRLIGFELADRAADPSLEDRLWEMLGSLTDNGIQMDLRATLDRLVPDDSEPLATIGFCVGARAVFRTLERHPDRFVVGAMWHPSYLADEEVDSPHRTAADVRQPLYVGIGDADQVQSIADQQGFFDAVAPLSNVEVEVFPGVDHAFTWPGWPNHDEAAAERAFAKTLALFAAHLG